MNVSVAPPSGLLSRLRAATAQAHAALERDLAFLSDPSDRGRILGALQRFHGFHLVWEPALAASPVGRAFAGHNRLPHLTADLQALGLSARDIAALPLCEAAAKLVATRARALGSLYVMEGSTLGGQVINHALRRTAWAPPGGLSYFNAHGKATAARWKDFLSRLDVEAAGEDADSVADGAVRTFERLGAWLTERSPELGAAAA
ncbi:MAG TPA: biliverdin-producing heme oxygenase [Mesorhizobium sp.]|nr:biliverdin-producing heme oxygenase [Mesorhizobium sp.]